jgi:hypothetical protein
MGSEISGIAGVEKNPGFHFDYVHYHLRKYVLEMCDCRHASHLCDTSHV